MNDKTEEKVAKSKTPVTNEQSNYETDSPLSKSAKKKAKKQQKRASESADENNTTDNSVTSNEKTPALENVKNNDQIDQIVPLIKKFDVNGKQFRTNAGHAAVHLGEITPHNILQLKKLNEAVFPIAYNDKFYVEARTCGDLGRLAYYNDVVVGAVCCRIDDISDEKSLYLMTLGTLAAYRQIGIGTILINYAIKLCKTLEDVKTMYLHVQVNNKNAVNFYEKHGFTNDGIIEDYYRISPRDAYLLIKRIRY